MHRHFTNTKVILPLLARLPLFPDGYILLPAIVDAVCETSPRRHHPCSPPDLMLKIDASDVLNVTACINPAKLLPLLYFRYSHPAKHMMLKTIATSTKEIVVDYFGANSDPSPFSIAANRTPIFMLNHVLGVNMPAQDHGENFNLERRPREQKGFNVSILKSPDFTFALGDCTTGLVSTHPLSIGNLSHPIYVPYSFFEVVGEKGTRSVAANDAPSPWHMSFSWHFTNSIRSSLGKLLLASFSRSRLVCALQLARREHSMAFVQHGIAPSRSNPFAETGHCPFSFHTTSGKELIDAVSHPVDGQEGTDPSNAKHMSFFALHLFASMHFAVVGCNYNVIMTMTIFDIFLLKILAIQQSSYHIACTCTGRSYLISRLHKVACNPFYFTKHFSNYLNAFAIIFINKKNTVYYYLRISGTGRFRFDGINHLLCFFKSKNMMHTFLLIIQRHGKELHLIRRRGRPIHRLVEYLDGKFECILHTCILFIIRLEE